MPEHVFTVVALGHSIDAQNNNVTLFCVLEQIGAVSFPVRIPAFSLVTLWRCRADETGGTFTQRTRLVDPDGKERVSSELSFAVDRPRQRVVNVFGNVPFEKAGTYRFEVYIRPDDAPDWGTPAASYPLEVIVADRPQGESMLLSEQTGV